jgi:hypothetical protein
MHINLYHTNVAKLATQHALPQWPNVANADMLCMHAVFQISLPFMHLETQTNPLWTTQQDLVFISSNDVIYASPEFNIINLYI